jgi:dihydroorotate dehydrogenase
MLYKICRPLIFTLEPELAHNLAIKLLKYSPQLSKARNYKNLTNKVADIDFSSPIGMAAGFDKNAEIPVQLSKFGFGFVECGTVTPLAQEGNPRPRIFRLPHDKAIINRLGFNNLGAKNFLNNIKNFLPSLDSSSLSPATKLNIPLGINIGKNKDSEALPDYLHLLDKFYDYASYITINISSPNTKNLRDLQKSDQINEFLKAIKNHHTDLSNSKKKYVPLFLKIAPDLTIFEQEEVARAILDNKIDGIIISNTTINRPYDLVSKQKAEPGGLSGYPIFLRSNQVLKNMYLFTKGQIPLIGVGGVFNADDAYHKIAMGASLVQIYTAFIYEGFGLVEKIKKDLSKKIAAQGFKNISEVIGVEAKSQFVF